MTEHHHRTQQPRWVVLMVVTVFLFLFFLGLSVDGWPGTALGIVLAFGFLSLAGHLWGYDSTDGRNWR
jgi:uncharacterized membrane protein YccC